MAVSPNAGGITAISRGRARSDATGIDRVNNFRILKGFQTHPSFWCRFNNVFGSQSVIPLGSMSDVNINTGGVAALSHRLITDVLPGRQ